MANPKTQIKIESISSNPDHFDQRKALTLDEVSRNKLIVGKRGAICPDTLRRWVKAGLRFPDGKLVKLPAIKVGKQWLTMEAWVRAFQTRRVQANLVPDPEKKRARKRLKKNSKQQ